MSDKKIALFHIFIALSFAGAIVLSSWILGDNEHSGTITYILIVLWFIPSSLLTTLQEKKKPKKKKK